MELSFDTLSNYFEYSKRLYTDFELGTVLRNVNLTLSWFRFF